MCVPTLTAASLRPRLWQVLSDFRRNNSIMVSTPLRTYVLVAMHRLHMICTVQHLKVRLAGDHQISRHRDNWARRKRCLLVWQRRCVNVASVRSMWRRCVQWRHAECLVAHETDDINIAAHERQRARDHTLAWRQCAAHAHQRRHVRYHERPSP